MNANNPMKKELTMHYVNTLLKRFNIFVYTGNLLDDLAIMELELDDLFEWKLITDEEFIHCKRVMNHYKSAYKIAKS